MTLRFRVKTRIQASTSESGDKLTVLAVLERILREDGLLGYYRGFMATMINTFSMRKHSTALRPLYTIFSNLLPLPDRIRVLLLLLHRTHVLHKAPRSEAASGERRRTTKHGGRTRTGRSRRRARPDLHHPCLCHRDPAAGRPLSRPSQGQGKRKGQGGRPGGR